LPLIVGDRENWHGTLFWQGLPASHPFTQRAVGLMGIKWSLRFNRLCLPYGLGVYIQVRAA
jgi:hypothetical protein